MQKFRMRAASMSAALFLGVVGVIAGAADARADTNLCNRSDYSCLTLTGYTKAQSVWGSWGGGHNCVSYVAFRLSRGFEATQPWSPIGNANQWDEKSAAVSPRYRVDKVPTVGSVAQWNTAPSGHVALVDEVYPSYIVISEDAYLTDTSGYSSRRRLDRTGTAFTTANFIHIRDAAYKVRGDANGDGRVNGIDLSMVQSNDGNARPRPNYTDGDVNRDYRVDAADLAIVLGSWTW